MTAPVLADALGPRARRRVAIASVVAAVVVLLVVGAAVKRFADQGQLDADRWRIFTEWSVIRFFLGGLLVTLRVALVAMGLALVLGVLLALGRLAQNAPLRWGTGVFVEFFRGLPVVLLILFCYAGLPRLGLDLAPFWYLVLGLVAYNSAVLAEIFRAGILSLDRGQGEAASALGLSYWQGMRLVLIPQAARRMTPALVSQLVTLLKDTALGFIIGFEELLRRANINGIFGNNLLQSYMVAAALYITVNFALSRVARRLEVRQRRRLGAGSIDVSGIEDLAAVQAHGTGAVS
jgi:glutamate transport system permease protein